MQYDGLRALVLVLIQLCATVLPNDVPLRLDVLQESFLSSQNISCPLRCGNVNQLLIASRFPPQAQPCQRFVSNASGHQLCSALVSSTAEGTRTTHLDGRAWQLQVINVTTVGTLITGTDSNDDHRSTFPTHYLFYNVQTGQSQRVPLVHPTHDAHYNHVTRTIHYLRIDLRPLTRACKPLRRGQRRIIETLVEVDLAGKVLWELPAEEVLCNRHLAQTVVEVFHLNFIMYLQSSDLLLVTSKHQSTAYAIRKSTRQLAWAVGRSATLPLREGGALRTFTGIHHFFPLPHDQFVVYHNQRQKPAEVPRAGSELLVVAVDARAGTASVRATYRHPVPAHREVGGTVLIGPTGMFGGAFGEPPLQSFFSFSANPFHWLSGCNFRHSMLYGGQFVFSDFGMRHSKGVLSFHSPFYVCEARNANLTICSGGRCSAVAVRLPPFMETVARPAPAALFTATLSSEDGFRAARTFPADDRNTCPPHSEPL
eukprot:EG_transcript_11145